MTENFSELNLAELADDFIGPRTVRAEQWRAIQESYGDLRDLPPPSGDGDVLEQLIQREPAAKAAPAKGITRALGRPSVRALFHRSGIQLAWRNGEVGYCPYGVTRTKYGGLLRPVLTWEVLNRPAEIFTPLTANPYLSRLGIPEGDQSPEWIQQRLWWVRHLGAATNPAALITKWGKDRSSRWGVNPDIDLAVRATPAWQSRFEQYVPGLKPEQIVAAPPNLR